MLNRFIIPLLAALLLAAPGARAQDDPEEALAEKKARLEELHREMGVAGSREEYDRLNAEYGRLAAEFKDLKRQIDAEANADTACKTAINDCNQAYKDREYAAARDAATEAIRLCPENPKAHYMLGLSQKKLGKYAEALAAFDAAVAADDGYLKALLAKGSLLADEMSRPADGLQVLRQLAASHPGYAKAHFEMGLIHMRLKEFTSAAADFQRAVDADPDDTKAWVALAQALVEAKDCNRALAAVDGALKDRGYREISEAYYQQAVAFNQCGRFAEAQAAAEACLGQINRLRSNKSFIQGGAWYEKGLSLDGRERYSEALRAFEEAASSRDWSQSARYEIERIKKEQGL